MGGGLCATRDFDYLLSLAEATSRQGRTRTNPHNAPKYLPTHGADSKQLTKPSNARCTAAPTSTCYETESCSAHEHTNSHQLTIFVPETMNCSSSAVRPFTWLVRKRSSSRSFCSWRRDPGSRRRWPGLRHQREGGPGPAWTSTSSRCPDARRAWSRGGDDEREPGAHARHRHAESWPAVAAICAKWKVRATVVRTVPAPARDGEPSRGLSRTGRPRSEPPKHRGLLVDPRGSRAARRPRDGVWRTPPVSRAVAGAV